MGGWEIDSLLSPLSLCKICHKVIVVQSGGYQWWVNNFKISCKRVSSLCKKLIRPAQSPYPSIYAKAVDCSKRSFAMAITHRQPLDNTVIEKHTIQKVTVYLTQPLAWPVYCPYTTYKQHWYYFLNWRIHCLYKYGLSMGHVEAFLSKLIIYQRKKASYLSWKHCNNRTSQFAEYSANREVFLFISAWLTLSQLQVCSKFIMENPTPSSIGYY